MDALALFHAYVDAFNRRDAEALRAVFATDLHSVHPGEPEVDVTASAPFVERMLALWPRGLHYKVLRATGRELGGGLSESWGELLVFNAEDRVAAAEVVIYNARGGVVTNTWIYKVMPPTHPDYRDARP
jgi:SnoaL-like domain